MSSDPSVAHVTNGDEEETSSILSATTSQRKTRSQTTAAAKKKKPVCLSNKRDPSLLPKYNTPTTKKKREGANASALKEISASMCRFLESRTNNQVSLAAVATRDVVESAVKILDTLGIDDDGYVEAIDYLGEEKAARTFLAMSDERRKLILRRKCKATFETTTEETNSNSTDREDIPNAAVVRGGSDQEEEVEQVVADSL